MTVETDSLDLRLDAIAQVEEFINSIHSIGDAIELKTDERTTTYAIKYLNSFRRAVSWVESTNNWKGYTNSDVIRSLKHLIMDASEFSITLYFAGRTV